MSACTEWASSTAAEVSAALAAPCIGLWAIGATEQHGPHVVTGFDHLAAQAVVNRVAGALGPRAIVLPPLAFGCSDHWKPFGATLSLKQDTMARLFVDVCRSAGEAGLRHLVVVNGHSGNIGVGMASVGALHDAGTSVELVSYWDLIGDLFEDIMSRDRGVGHAGEMETSIGLHLGDLVRPDLVPSGGAPYAGAKHGVGIYGAVRMDPAASNGVVGIAEVASAETGRRLVEAACARLEAHCCNLLGDASAEA